MPGRKSFGAKRYRPRGHVELVVGSGQEMAREPLVSGRLVSPVSREGPARRVARSGDCRLVQALLVVWGSSEGCRSFLA
ncbi:hypothetical protein P5W02_09685 [Mycobacteroides abscessus subsp. abscessus]|uniref:hypothetical protein n=1 Tax=Mycobacteroides abscessus TaxID=36809 RepID=UPI00266C9A65|nr:hypothetical protein [Mycobacteroides abscessus]MDO3103012.1 hypothetical protein [Mycobacteroides abscessus subsp. abscessus]